MISDSGTSFNVVEGNLIGTDPSGLNGAGNGGDGVLVQNGASSNLIGGAGTRSANLISDNGGDGVRLTGSGTDLNSVMGNDIGFSEDEATLNNGGYDVQIDSGAMVGDFVNNAIPSTGTTSGVPAQSPPETGTPIPATYNLEGN